MSRSNRNSVARSGWSPPPTQCSRPIRTQGVKQVAVAAPGFSADCIETLEELGIRGRKSFLHSGGEQFALLDCLNNSPESIAMLERLIERELAGWLPRD